MLKVKRVYEQSEPKDGARFLVERLWPRGIRKDNLKMDAWLKDASPSVELRRWFGHDPENWDEFQRRYRDELEADPKGWLPLLEAAQKSDVTLLYSAKDKQHNSAILLQVFLEERLALIEPV